jgi:hypothetical protein
VIGVIDLEGQCAFLSIVALSRVSVRQHIWEKIMKYFAILSLVALLMTSEPVRASQILGPFPDGDTTITPDDITDNRTITINTRFMGHRDKIIIIFDKVAGSTPTFDPFIVSSAAFLTFPGSDEQTGTAIVTTIYGEKRSDGSVTGFTDPSIFQPIGGETIWGVSGKEYYSYFSEKISGTDLATTLPGYNLTSFDLGTTSPYQVFHTEVPISDISRVPEPSALALLLVGISGLTCVRLKAKRPKRL